MNQFKNKQARKGNALVYIIMAIIAIGVLAAVMVPSFKNADMGPRISNIKEYINYVNKTAIPQYMAQTSNKDFDGLNMCQLVESGIFTGAYAAKVYDNTGLAVYVKGTPAKAGPECSLLLEGPLPSTGVAMFANVGTPLSAAATGNYTIALRDSIAKDGAPEKTAMEKDLSSYLATISGNDPTVANAFTVSATGVVTAVASAVDATFAQGF